MAPRLLAAMLVVCLIDCLAGSAHGMGIRTEVGVLAWSKDGQGVVLDESASGPEGGGAHSLVVVTTALPHVVRFALSSDFSPGDGSRPQRVSVAACTAAARKLAILLKSFPGVRVVPARCKTDRQIVSVDAAKQKPLAVTVLPGAGLSLRAAGKQLELVKDGKTLVAFPGDSAAVSDLTATLGPAGHLLVLLTEGGFRVLGSGSGKPGDLAPITP